MKLYYQCLRCEARHYNEYPLYQEHFDFKDKGGVRMSSELPPEGSRPSLIDIRQDIVTRLEEHAPGTDKRLDPGVEYTLIHLLSKIDGIPESKIWDELLTKFLGKTLKGPAQ